MRRVVFIVTLALLPLPAPPAHAQSQTGGQALETCLAAAGASMVALQACKGALSEPCLDQPGSETTVGSVQCLLAEERGWSAQLDAALARGRANAPRAQFLQRSQEAWTAWREAECRYQASLYEGGSLARVLTASCRADLTADRAIALLYAERTPVD